MRGGIQVCAVKTPGFGENRKTNAVDIAIQTGAQVVSDDLGLTLDDLNMSHLGTAKAIDITKDDTIITEGAGAKEVIEERKEFIREMMQQTASEYEKGKLKERLAKLSGGVAVIHCGGASEVEVGEKKDRIEDALNATQAAVASGIVPGGGVALLQASKVLDGVKGNNFDQLQGIKILQSVLKVYFYFIFFIYFLFLFFYYFCYSSFSYYFYFFILPLLLDPCQGHRPKRWI